MSQSSLDEIRSIHSRIQNDISKRLDEFGQVWITGTDEDIFAELVFCFFTPQSKARSCWAAVENLRKNNLLMKGGQQEIAAAITGVRFHHTKAARVIRARYQFFEGGESLKSTIASFQNPKETREWMVENVNGLGYKEASHFLRNIGMGQDLAILDRHILRNLVLLGMIDEVPSSISRNNYLEMEGKMTIFSNKIGIPMDHLDMLLWYKEAGEIFK